MRPQAQEKIKQDPPLEQLISVGEDGQAEKSIDKCSLSQ
jgi:hypothetical protein